MQSSAFFIWLIIINVIVASSLSTSVYASDSALTLHLDQQSNIIPPTAQWTIHHFASRRGPRLISDSPGVVFRRSNWNSLEKNPWVDAMGSMTVQLLPKQKATTNVANANTNANAGASTTSQSSKSISTSGWFFDNALPAKGFSQRLSGFGVVSLSSTREDDDLRASPEEAILLRFDVSDFTLTNPGATLIFRLTMKAAKSARLYQKQKVVSDDDITTHTAALVGSIPSTALSVTPDIPLRKFGGSNNTDGIYEFALADFKWNGVGGGRGRLLALTFDIVITPPAFHSLFTQDMILQRDVPVAVYGTAAENRILEITFGEEEAVTDFADGDTTSFYHQIKTTRSDPVTGAWKVVLDPMPASTQPRQLKVRDRAYPEQYQSSLANILVGDIWLAGGQSNMGRPFKEYAALEKDWRKAPPNPNLRLVHVAETWSAVPLEEPVLDDFGHPDRFSAIWHESRSEYLSRFSPAAYFFATTLQRELTRHDKNNHVIPIGIIEVALGATKAEVWTPAEELTELGYSIVGTYSQAYNGMIYPLHQFPIKGVIFYQGESNTVAANNYADLFQGLIGGWRRTWNRPNLPFYFCQLSSVAPRSSDPTGENWARLREAQTAALALPHTGMVVTTDIGEYSDVHPQDKETVGERLALHALAAAGVKDRRRGKDFVGSAPTLVKMRKRGKWIILKFSGPLQTQKVVMNNERYLPPRTDSKAIIASDDEIVGFSVTNSSKATNKDGDDAIFVEADVASFRSGGTKIRLSSTLLEGNPVHVRYCWKSFGLCNLYAAQEEGGLPIGTFRTDSFRLPGSSSNTAAPTPTSLPSSMPTRSAPSSPSPSDVIPTTAATLIPSSVSSVPPSSSPTTTPTSPSMNPSVVPTMIPSASSPLSSPMILAANADVSSIVATSMEPSRELQTIGSSTISKKPINITAATITTAPNQ